MSLRLRIEHGQDAGKTMRLSRTGVYTLGRGTDNSMRVLDMKVSKQHCEVRVAENNGELQAVLHDLGSTHGCQLNGQPVTKDMPLNPGDELRLGLTILRILSAGDADGELEPVAGRDVDSGAMAAAAGNGNQPRTKQTLAPDEIVGKELGGYSVESKIGAGGMGGVYLAEQTSLKRKVALKVLNEKFASDSAFVDQFVNEARAAGALNHPNVVQVYDVGNAAGHYFFSMEVMPGGSVEEKIREGEVSWEAGLNWFIDASNALIFAKRRDILHRDVKPDNLMVAEDESAKLCDLGLAKKSEVKDLMDQGIIGTPHFISPEAIRRKGDIDHRTDLYSLGCTFFRVFTGKNPFPGSSVKEILLGHLNKPVPRVNDHNPSVPAELDEVIYKLMRKDPEDRIQTPEELLRELDSIRTKYNLEAHGIKPASKKPLVIGGVAAAIAIGIAIFVAMKPREKEIIPKTAAELRAEKDAKLGQLRGELQPYVNEAVERLNELLPRLLNNKLEEGQNWKKPVFVQLVKDYSNAADDWQAKNDEWTGRAAKEEDAEFKSIYDTQVGKLAAHIKTARDKATYIDTEVKAGRQNEKRYNEAKVRELANMEADFKSLAAALKKLFDDGGYLGLETKQGKHEWRVIVKKYDEMKVRTKLFDLEKEIRPVLDRHLPAEEDDKTGETRGKRLVDEALRAIGRAAGAKINEARQFIGHNAGNTEYKHAIDMLKAYLEKLPEPPYVETAPRTGIVYEATRQLIQDEIEQLREEQQELEWRRLRHDRVAYQQFLRAIWAPNLGLLRKFDFDGALAEVAKAKAAMQDGRYRRLMDRWPPPIEAMKSLFARTIEAYPDGWVGKYYYYVDDKGKTKKDQIRAIDARSIKLGRETHTLVDLGPAELLDKLFFFEAEARLKDCTAEDHYGLALLAELAGDYDIAPKQYRAARAGFGGKPPSDLIMQREGELPDEKEVAERWLIIESFLGDTGETIDPFEEMAEEVVEKGNPQAFSQEDRGKAIDAIKEIERKMQNIRNMGDEIEEQRDLAKTVWGSSLREDGPHAEVSYAGERVPPPLTPKKGAGGDGNKDEDGKKPNGAGPVKKPGGDKPGADKKGKSEKNGSDK